MIRILIDLIGKIWALPITVIGLVLGCVGWAAGHAMRTRARINVGNNAIQFIQSPVVLNGCAITLGNVILYGKNACPSKHGVYNDPAVNLGLHEKAHTYQWQLFGVFFLLVYLCAGGFTGPQRNRFERAAQKYGRGAGNWWSS